MTKQKKGYCSLLLIIIALLTSLGCKAQDVKQELDSLEINIGEQIQLHLTVTAPKGARVELPSFKPQQEIIPGVEVLEQHDHDTLQLNDGKVQMGRDFLLTSFDEKVYAIPALKVKVNGKNYQGNPLALKVLTVPVDTVHTNQYYPPKDVQDNPFWWSEWSVLFWLSMLSVLLVAAAFFLIHRLRSNKPIRLSIRIVKRVPAHEKALGEIKAIKQERQDSQEGQKLYYTRLTDTLRQYIESRFGFRAKEMTSAEIISQLRENGDSEMIDELRNVFHTADLVKFAKYETILEESDSNLVTAIHFIDQTKTEEKPTEEKIMPELSTQDKQMRQQRNIIKVLLTVSILLVIVLIAYVVYELAMLLM